MEAERARGRCLCGQVQFELTLPVKFNAHCHCSMCRAAHGAAFVTWVGVERDAFHLTQGAQDLVRHKSSEQASRSFCGTCGSTLLFESERWPGEVHVAFANLVDPVDRPPQAHVYFSDRVPWVTLSDDLHRIDDPKG